MMYKIGGFNVEIISKYPYILSRAQKYKESSAKRIDFTITPSRYKSIDCSLYPNKNVMEYCLLGDNFAEKVLNFNSIVIHGSAISVNNRGYIFSADSGTGKTTHTLLWKKLVEDSEFNYINDDKPLIRIIENQIGVYGTPFSGKTDWNSNIGVMLNGICFIKQDTTNWIRKLEIEEAFLDFKNQTLDVIPMNLYQLRDETIDYIIKHIPIYEMGCRADINAAKLSYKVMTKKYKLDKGCVYEG